MAQTEITNAIVKHIFKNLGLFENVSVSICQETFLTDKNIAFLQPESVTSSHGHEELAPVWACETSVNNIKFGIICTSFVTPNENHVDDTENFVVVKLEGQPAYGCYLISGGLGTSAWDGFIATELKPKMWIPTTTYIQATFLAGMEQLRDLVSKYDKVDNVEDLFMLLKEFIAYRESYDQPTEETVQ